MPFEDSGQHAKALSQAKDCQPPGCSRQSVPVAGTHPPTVKPPGGHTSTSIYLPLRAFGSCVLIASGVG